MIKFACLVPHPPIILPDIGLPADRRQVKKTITSLEKLGKRLKVINPDYLVISSPHPDWGFNVPQYFLTKELKEITTKPYLTNHQSPRVHFEKGKTIAKNLLKNKTAAWIASGDMSHRLKEDGPYGFHPSGKKFDETFIKLLKNKDTQAILNLPNNLIKEAGECGLRSFCMALGALENSQLDWQPDILSYQAPFGVGYLVVNFKFTG